MIARKSRNVNVTPFYNFNETSDIIETAYWEIYDNKHIAAESSMNKIYRYFDLLCIRLSCTTQIVFELAFAVKCHVDKAIQNDISSLILKVSFKEERQDVPSVFRF